MRPQCVVQVWHLTLRVEKTINEMVFKENETVLQKRSPFTPTTTELTLTPWHRASTPGTAWLLTQQSASWTNITWIQFFCNHFPSSIHCAQLVLRRFALAKNCEFFSLYFFNHTKPPSCQKNSPIIRNNSSSCKHKSWNGDSYRKTKNVLLTVRENLSLQSLGFSLPTLCWLLGERKWKRARFCPPENNSNPAKRKSNIQSTSQETILKPKTSQWKIHLSAAGMCEPLRLPLSRLQPQNNPNHTTPPVVWGQNPFLFSPLPPYRSRFFSPSHLSFLYLLHPTHAKLLFFSHSLLSASYQQTHNCFKQKGNCGSSLCRLEIEEWQLLIRSTNLNQEVFFSRLPCPQTRSSGVSNDLYLIVFNYPGSLWGLVPNLWDSASEDHMTPPRLPFQPAWHLKNGLKGQTLSNQRSLFWHSLPPSHWLGARPCHRLACLPEKQICP